MNSEEPFEILESDSSEDFEDISNNETIKESKTETTDNKNTYEKYIEILHEFKCDLAVTFPEIKEKLNLLKDEECYTFCSELYPKLFFDILYENNSLFEESKILLPTIDFSSLFNDSQITDKTKKTIWKYLQLLLFVVVENAESNESFGDVSKLFEAIREEELHKKIAESMNEMKDLFGDMEDSSSNVFDESFDAEKVKSHLDGLMNGKIGSLAKEIAEEASKDFGDIGSQEDFMKTFMKNPTKILELVKGIGSKIEDKIKTGEVKQSELLEEANEIIKNMKDIPGIKEIMSKMGMNGKMDFKGMANKIQENLKMAKMKERLNKKRQDRNQSKTQIPPDVKITQKDDDSFLVNLGTEPKKSSSRHKQKKKKGKH
jgi:hypothetical protein